ncbi:helix-turn-helix transcriptional regulator [Amycolatopsis sp. NPDC088138]|uniref:helix-turn-helix transcriptional regulator n=1 Tax=Amycolatopsis sp. NPDC088138 TaxID=3363938 RepID=UPI003801330A
MTLEEVCAELRINRSTFNDWRAKKCAPTCLKLPNGKVRFRRSELDRRLSSRAEVTA